MQGRLSIESERNLFEEVQLSVVMYVLLILVCIVYSTSVYLVACDTVDAARGKEYHQVPYSSSSLRVLGLPEGISFCNPRGLRVANLQRIVAAEQQISFVVGKYYIQAINNR